MIGSELVAIWDDLKSNFNELYFDEKEHKYYISGERYPSVTGIISAFYEKFDTENEAKKYSEKRNFTYDDIISAWNGEGLIATTKGTRVHLFGESYVKWKYFNIGEKPLASCKQCLGVIEYWNDLPSYLIPVALELQMYSKKYRYSGTCDILLYNTLTNTFVLADYKTNKELFDQNKAFPSKEMLIIDKKHGLTQNNFGKYTLQLSLYQILLEEIGLPVSSRMIVWLNQQDDGKLHQTYRTKDITKDLRSWLEAA